MPFEVTREELFRHVWERPMTKVAADYGISDVALRKICNKHKIPLPPQGHWARKAAGRQAPERALPELTNAAASRVVIFGSRAGALPEPVRLAKAEAMAREQRPENRIVVFAGAELDPAVVRTKTRLNKTKPSERGLLQTSTPDVFNVQVGPNSVDRVIEFLNALVMAAQQRAHRLGKGAQSLQFLVDDEPIDFKIVEEITRTKHVPTESDRAALAKWDQRQSRRLASWNEPWIPRPNPPEWDYLPNGRLQVILNERSYGHDRLRRTFSDGRSQRVEDLINDLLESFSTWSASIKAKRTHDQKRQLEWKQEEQRREEERRRNALERKRVQALAGDLELRRHQQETLAFVAVVETKLRESAFAVPETVRDWIAWAKDYVDRVDPLREGLPRLLRLEDFNEWELHSSR